MGIIVWIIIGGIAGWLAGKVMGNGKRQGCLVDILLGILGGVLGGFIFRLTGGSGVTGLNLWSLFVAFIGAVLLITIIRVLKKVGD